MIEIDELVTVDVQNAIEKFVLSTSFPWFYSHNTITVSELTKPDYIALEQGINPPQLVHNLVVNGKQQTEFFSLIQPILDQLTNYYKKDCEIFRAKFNLLSKNDDSMYHYPHIDTETFGANTMIYYVNESDGDTFLFDGIGPNKGEAVAIDKQISPKKGKAIIFPANQFHSSSSPINASTRVVLNVVFKILN